MKTIALDFNKRIAVGTDDFNNPMYETEVITVDGCLIAPITEPANAREQQAMHQNREQVRIHLPKSFTGDVSESDVLYDGKVFHLDSDGTAFMMENTPTKWNRYIRAERINT